MLRSVPSVVGQRSLPTGVVPTQWPIVCEASDSGRLDDSLAGRRLPPAGVVRGHGLFLVNTIADLVRSHTTPTGTTIQAYLRLQPR